MVKKYLSPCLIEAVASKKEDQGKLLNDADAFHDLWYE